MRKGLGYHNRRSPFGFNPGTLFAGGAQGVWYDPSDSSTLFEDTAGTIPCGTPGATVNAIPVGKMLDKSGNGNHAIAWNTSNARPVLSARVNLLTKTEEFNDAVWNKQRITVQQDTAVAPNGTTTADLQYLSASGNSCEIWRDVTVSSGVSYVMSVFAKASGKNFVALGINDGLSGVAFFNLATGAIGTVAAGLTASIQDAGNGWHQCSVTFTASGAGVQYTQMVTNADNSIAATANGTDGILVWGADLRPANIGTSVPAYQRIADAYTYDSSGFPRYLVFNGTASGMYTPANLNLIGTAQASVFVGVRKISDAALGVVAEFSAGIATNNGSFLLSAPNSAAANYNFSSKGTTQVDNTVTTYTAPISNVVTGQGNISGPSNVIRVNGTQAGSVVTTQGTGNYGTFALNLGARNAQSGTPTVGTFLNGYLYSLIVVGAASTAAQISSTESWINVKEGGVY